MTPLGPLEVASLKTLEKNFIKELVAQSGGAPCHSADNALHEKLIGLEHKDEINIHDQRDQAFFSCCRDHLSKIESLRHKREFAQDLAVNFDGRMKQINFGPLEEYEKAVYINALTVYCAKSDSYINAYAKDLDNMLTDGPDKFYENKDPQKYSSVSLEYRPGNAVINMQLAEGRRPEPLSVAELQRDANPAVPVNPESISFKDSVSNFFSQIYQSLVSGLESLWTGNSRVQSAPEASNVKVK